MPRIFYHLQKIACKFITLFERTGDRKKDAAEIHVIYFSISLYKKNLYKFELRNDFFLMSLNDIVPCLVIEK